jgi:hypothetical protein
VLIEDAIRGIGVAVLWLLSLGRYRPDGQGGLLLEGAVGLLAVAVVIWLTSR